MLVEFQVLGFEDFTHAAVAESTKDSVTAGNDGAGLEGGGSAGASSGSMVEQSGLRVLVEHAPHFREKLGVAHAFLPQILLNLGRWQRYRRIEDRADPMPAFRRHEALRVYCVCSQARALR